MTNTIWNKWYYQDRFLGKPYPFIDNYPRPDMDELKRIKESKLEKKSKLKNVK